MALRPLESSIYERQSIIFDPIKEFLNQWEYVCHIFEIGNQNGCLYPKYFFNTAKEIKSSRFLSMN